MGLEIKLEEMNLGNLAEGSLERRFQDCMVEIAQIFSQSGVYATDAGRVVAKVKMVAEFRRDDDGDVEVWIGADVVGPKRKMVSRGGTHYRNGKWLVSEEHKQDPLPMFPRAAGDTSKGGE